MKTSKLLAVAVLAATVLGFGNSAQAAVYTRNDCPTSFTTDPTAKVEDSTGTTTAASDCEYLTPPQANFIATIENINDAGFFGFSDWTYNAAKVDLVPASTTGTWAITAADFVTYDYIIVFKDGGDTNLVAFLFNELYVNGVWTSPFENPPFDVNNPTDVSHYTIAQRTTGEPPCEVDCGPREIPEPNGLALMSLGLLGAAFAVQRRRSHRRA
jgi:hypothetical protein